MYRYIYEARLSGVEEPFLTISKLLLDELLRGTQRITAEPARVKLLPLAPLKS